MVSRTPSEILDNYDDRELDDLSMCCMMWITQHMDTYSESDYV